MAESIIKVIVSDQISGTANGINTSVQTGSLTNKQQMVKTTPSAKSNLKFARTIYGAFQVAKTVSNQVIANVGTYTGDSMKQTEINNIQTANKLAADLAINPTAALTSMAISAMSTVWNENHRRKMEAINLANQRARNGYSNSSSILTSRRH